MAKTLSEGFNSFLSRLTPLASEHEKAQRHRTSVANCMKNNFECYSFFETGSFGNKTGVRHFSDTDYFAACPAKELWTDSSTTLRKVREALEGTFWNTSGIVVKTPAILIPFGIYPSETMEVTPCTFNGLIETPVGKQAYYTIPAYNGDWINSSPQAHNAYVAKHDYRLGGKLKPLIQLVKAWKFYNNVPILSFYLELRVTKYAEGESSIVYDIDLKHVIKYILKSNLASIIDPMGISGYVPPCSSDAKLSEALSKLNSGLTRAEKAVEQREKNLDMAFHWWDLFFANEFPAR